MAQRSKAAGVTFSLIDEDHTIGNSVRFILNQECVFACYSDMSSACSDVSPASVLSPAPSFVPRVSFCGYSVPHPSDNKVNIRVQTTGDPAREVLKDGLLELAGFCEHVTRTFESAFDKFERRRRGEAVEEEEEEGDDEDMQDAS
ncbi:unnamed protein product [Closterium sp. Naga37s-1]|nr:unnamed protein product [Closterium sp. Naga37s-1]